MSFCFSCLGGQRRVCLWGWWFALREGPVGRILSPAQYGGEMAPSSAALGLWGPRPAGGWHCFVFLPIGSWHFGEHLLEYVPELGGVNSVFSSISTLLSCIFYMSLCHVHQSTGAKIHKVTREVTSFPFPLPPHLPITYQ